MNQDRLKLWIDALRSGEYQQTQGQLGRVDPDGVRTYCCLGVLCEVAIKNGLDLGVSLDSSIETCGCDECPDAPADVILYDSEESHTPEAVREWLGIDTNVPYVVATRNFHRSNDPECLMVALKGNVTSVVTLNDTVGVGFDEIADALEATYPREGK